MLPHNPAHDASGSVSTREPFIQCTFQEAPPRLLGRVLGKWSPKGTRVRGLTRYCPPEFFLGTRNLIYSWQQLTLERLANPQMNRKQRVTRKHTRCIGRTAC